MTACAISRIDGWVDLPQSVAMISHAQLDRERLERREGERGRMRARLREVLRDELGAGSRVWVFGSLCREGAFTAYSDIDVAIDSSVVPREPHEIQRAISAGLCREADVYLLEKMRIADRIRREGELWIL